MGYVAILLLLAASGGPRHITQSEVAAELESAKAEWGQDVDATIELRVLNPCDLVTVPDVAFTEVVSTTIDGITTTVRHIRINAACDWSDKHLNLHNVVLHEYGHALGLMEHSTDKESVMFRVVNAKQTITPADRARLKQ